MNPFLLDFLISQGMNSGLYAMALLTNNPQVKEREKTTIGHFVVSACLLYGWTVPPEIKS